jgi:multidrug efflux pump subunit AcrA (membrane-fusion protein)
MVPVRTIQKDESNASYVYVVEGNVAKRRIITLGKEYNGQVEVLSGLKAGDQLITMGYDLVNENSPVSFKR